MQLHTLQWRALSRIAVALRALAAGWVHPNLNLDNPEDAVDLSKVVGRQKEQVDIDIALSNSFGFGGHNVCLAFRRMS